MKMKNSAKPTIYIPDFEGNNPVTFVAQGVKAGFPSPALDFMEYKIDLNKELSKNPVATFYIKADGNSMVDAGIDSGDVLVVDRSLEPRDGKIAVCLIDTEFTVKRLKMGDGRLFLMPGNDAYPPIEVTEHNQFSVWGIVTYVIKKM